MEFVKLTNKEHSKLVEKFGSEGTEQRIAALNDYIGSKGKKYTSHYHTILSWERRAVVKDPPRRCSSSNCKKLGIQKRIDDTGQVYWLCEDHKMPYKSIEGIPKPQMKGVPSAKIDANEIRNRNRKALGIK